MRCLASSLVSLGALCKLSLSDFHDHGVAYNALPDVLLRIYSHRLLVYDVLRDSHRHLWMLKNDMVQTFQAIFDFVVQPEAFRAMFADSFIDEGGCNLLSIRVLDD
ncbi:hypothetical protein F2Q70_00025017 [Brassica cretica]|uniref:Uncharacterized protein n=1 Tax=Brassica cretica TaxID=69181 RepID=A0A8S9LBZ8_BRACR|nr:hypothetical protein F2Q70_00025017 [Brassica cretica]